MIRFAIFFSLISIVPLQALDKIPETYRVTFGNPKARFKVTEYFSFVCPACIALFRKDFQEIKKTLIDTDEIFFEFHPVPQDLPTVQAMACFEKLTESEKQLFVEVILDSVNIEDSATTPLLMQKAMSVLGKPIPGLQDESYITNTKAFQIAFEFIKQEDRIEGIPTIEINGKLYPEIPERQFIEQKLEELKRRL